MLERMTVVHELVPGDITVHALGARIVIATGWIDGEVTHVLELRSRTSDRDELEVFAYKYLFCGPAWRPV